MRVRDLSCLALVASVLAPAGCDEDAPPPSQPPVVDSRSLGGSLARACARLRRTERVPVLCPGWLPSTRTGAARYEGYTMSQRDFERSRCEYLTQMEYSGRGAGRTVPFHVLFGGRCGRVRAEHGHLRLATRVATPGEGERLVRPRRRARVSVDGHPARVLQFRHAPEGGIHGGHYGIVWNAAGAGYALSFHYNRGDTQFEGVDRALPPGRGEVRKLVRAAESMTGR